MAQQLRVESYAVWLGGSRPTVIRPLAWIAKVVWLPFGLLLRILGFLPRGPIGATDIPQWTLPVGDNRQLWRAIEQRRASGDPLRHLWQEVERSRAARKRRALGVAPVPVVSSPTSALVARVNSSLSAAPGAPAASPRAALDPAGSPTLSLVPAVSSPTLAKPRKRRRLSKRIVMGVGYIASLAAVAALVGGATYGFFSATKSSQSNTFTAGTVTLGSDASGACSVVNLLPDGSAHNCTLKITYQGNSAGFMALDVLIETQAGSGGTKLYIPSDSLNDLQVSVTSVTPPPPSSPTSTVTYTVPTTATSCPGSAPMNSTCYELDDELVSTSAFTNASSTVQFTTSLSLPTSSTTGYQGGAAQVIVTAHAVQSAHNPLPGSCTTAGQSCTTETWK